MYRILSIFVTLSYFILKVESNNDMTTFLLPNTIKPKNYNLSLTIYLDDGSPKDFTFDGHVKIDIQIDEPVRSIVLHSKGLKFSKENIVLNKDDQFLNNYIIDLNDMTSLFNITMLHGEVFNIGNYTLTVSYSGIINNDLNGLFKTSYDDINKQTRWMAATFFEPNYARCLFPCFDQFHFKSTFDVTVINSNKYNAISNMPIDYQCDTKSNMKTTTFRRTPPMSTYLLAIAVFDLEHIQNDSNNFTIYATPENIEYANYLLKLGETILNRLESLTNINYEIGKMDIVIIPNDFDEAIESWGLIMSGQDELIFKYDSDTIEKKYKIIDKISHGIAHQWFGNAVTPKSLKHLWLKEGLTTYFSLYALQEIEPAWRRMDEFIANKIIRNALPFESGTIYTPPISQEVHNLNNEKIIFHFIKYIKGTAIIRMISNIVSKSTFLNGINRFLRKKYCKTTDSDEFFAIFQETLNAENVPFSIKNIVDSWIYYKQYPLLNVNRNYREQTVEFSQKHFLSYEANKKEMEDNHLWHIPINYATTKKLDFYNTVPEFWLTTESMPPTFNYMLSEGDWIIVNKELTGYYRVNYDDKNWELIISHLNSNERENIPVLNRVQLINDAYALVQTRLIRVDIFFQLIDSLKQESDYIVWLHSFEAIYWLHNKLVNSKHYTVFQYYFGKLLKSIINKFGYEESATNTDIDKMVRSKLILFACSIGNAFCLDNMKKQLIKLIKNPQQNVTADLKKKIIRFGLQGADMILLEKTVKFSNQQLDMVKAIGYSANENILNTYFNASSRLKLSYDNKIMIIDELAYIPGKIDMALDYLTKIPSDYISNNLHRIITVLPNIVERLTLQKQLIKLQNSGVLEAVPKNLKTRSITKIEDNINLVDTYEEILYDMLKAFVSRF